MSRTRRTVVDVVWGVALLAVQLGCSGADELTCELMADPQNCWAEASAEIAECLPPPGEIGVLSADRATCDFADGTEIVFDVPVPTDSFDAESFGFVINTAAGRCGRVLDTFQNRIEIESSSQVVSASLGAGETFELDCGGGERYTTSFDTLFDCAAEGIPPPTDGFELTPTLVTFRLSSVTTPNELFRCTPP